MDKEQYLAGWYEANLDKEVLISWNEITTKENSTGKDLYEKLLKDYYPSNMQTLGDFKFLENTEEENDWFLLKVYKELFNGITILFHRKYLISTAKINIPNILDQAVKNSLLDELIIFVYNEIKDYKKYSAKNLEKYVIGRRE